jgi:hypothetical protein
VLNLNMNKENKFWTFIDKYEPLFLGVVLGQGISLLITNTSLFSGTVICIFSLLLIGLRLHRTAKKTASKTANKSAPKE